MEGHTVRMIGQHTLTLMLACLFLCFKDTKLSGWGRGRTDLGSAVGVMNVFKTFCMEVSKS